MSDTVPTGTLSDLLSAAHTLIDELQTVELTRCADPEIVDGLRELERLRRRLDAVDYRVIHEVERRGVAHAHGCPTTGRFLEHALRLGRGEGYTRVDAAAAAGPRTTPTGEPLGPVFVHVAAAQAAGVVSQHQARVIARCVDELPGEVQVEHGEQVERDLVGYASAFGPVQLACIARRISAHLNPDGKYCEPDVVQRRRWLRLTQRPDGTGHLEGELTPELTERLLTLFDTLAAPRPADAAGVKDDRKPEQRCHDALLDVCELGVREGRVPSNNGVSATIVVTMTSEQYASGDGLAELGHGATVPTRSVKTWSGGDTEILAVVFDKTRAVTHYSSTHRIFTEHQRRVIAARDRGCTFPGCSEPPGRCQIDHIPRWEHTGITTVAGGVLECRFHHREAETLGWRPVILHGTPHWIPPAWIDPAQTPVRNTRHDTLPAA